MSAPVTEGDVLFDKYRVERVLGKGGMGIVVAAMHIDLEQRVALKFLLPEALEHPEIVERFAREAKAAARIRSQHVVRVIDTGRMPDGTPFMVMEHLEGSDLGDVLDAEGPLPLGVAVDYVLQACEAVAEAHAAGIIHRDLKPSNLYLARQADRRSIIKVLDFGISKLAGPEVGALTRTATMMGSPQYMSPEQLTSSKDVDARSDIWALGVILYELVSGSPPFRGETMPEIVGKILQNTPERLSATVAGIPIDFELVVARCLASRLDDRFTTVGDLVAALVPFAGDEGKASATSDRILRVLGGASLRPPTPQRVSVSEPDRATRLGPAAATAPTVVPALGDAKQTTAQAGVPSVSTATAQTPVVEARSTAEPSADRSPASPARRTIALAAILALVLVALAVGRKAIAPPVEASPTTSATVTASAPPVAVTESATAAAPPPPAEPSVGSGLPVAATTPPAKTHAGVAPRPSQRAPAAPAASSPVMTSATTDPKKSPLNMGIK